MEMLNTIKNLSLKQPDALAYVSPSANMTYKELWEQSDQVATYVLKQKLTCQSPIIIYGHMEPSMLAAFLGSVKAGHPYIPIDTSIPLERIHRIVDNSKSELVINISERTLDIPQSNVLVTSYHEVHRIQESIHLPLDDKNWVTGNENFYIIYTSGSTGNPKGVQISANNLQSFVDWMVKDFPINETFCFLNQAPYSFDLSVMDVYPSLASGGTIMAVTKEMIDRPKLLFQALQGSSIQIWTSTPSFVQMCLMDPSFSQNLLTDLKVFLFCGEILPSTICRQLLDRFPGVKIYNTYGPTEATVAVTSIEITTELLEQYPILPIGKVKNDTQIVILDENGKEAPVGEQGELVIIGPSVSKGYLGEPELTEKAFYQINNQQAYRTGDAGYVNQEGFLFYKGRLDFQIKLHGYRMELEEIEFHISQSSFVESAVVIPIYKDDKIDYLLAAIIPTKHSFEKEYQLTSSIKKELAETIPSYMIPRVFMYQRDLPITSNGKVDRKKIREMVRS